MVAVSLVISGLSASSSEHIHTTWRRGRVKRCTRGEKSSGMTKRRMNYWCWGVKEDSIEVKRVGRLCRRYMHNSYKSRSNQGKLRSRHYGQVTPFSKALVVLKKHLNNMFWNGWSEIALTVKGVNFLLYWCCGLGGSGRSGSSCTGCRRWRQEREVNNSC